MKLIIKQILTGLCNALGVITLYFIGLAISYSGNIDYMSNEYGTTLKILYIFLILFIFIYFNLEEDDN